MFPGLVVEQEIRAAVEGQGGSVRVERGDLAEGTLTIPYLPVAEARELCLLARGRPAPPAIQPLFLQFFVYSFPAAPEEQEELAALRELLGMRGVREILADSPQLAWAALRGIPGVAQVAGKLQRMPFFANAQE